ncbi:MAG TPA: YcxB family protein [Pirellulales bacterium]|nr:YcxB family protein [Pirellulales bacterium]
MANQINPYNAGPSVVPGFAPPVGDVTEVVYELELDDLIAFSMHHRKTSPAMRRQLRAAYLIVPAMFCVLAGLVMVAVHDEGMRILLAIFLLATGAILFLLGPLLSRHRTARFLAKIYAEGSNRALLGWRRLSLGREGVAMSSELIESRMKWPAIEKIESSDQYAFIYIGSANALVVPLRAFASPAHFMVFVETARNHWRQTRDALGPTA